MKMYLLEPEVPGGIGENSKFLYENGRIKQVIHLHYEFEGWLGDDLITTSPYFIVTEKLANEIEQSDINGYQFKNIEVSTSDGFKEMYPNKVLPNFKMVVPLGIIETEKECIIKWTGHDLCLGNKVDFIVSEKAMGIFRKYNLKYCDITELCSRIV